MTGRPRAALAAFSLAVLLTGSQAGADWPQWRGPGRDGHASVAAPAAWPAQLAKVWAVEVGGGHATPLLAGEIVYVFGREGENETVAAYALADGRRLWRDAYPQPYAPHQEAAGHGKGPFATPLLAAGRLFTFGIDEVLSAYQASGEGAGKLLWRRDHRRDYPLPRPYYGTSFSPLLADGKLIVHVGGPDPQEPFSAERPGSGALLALDPASGAELWRATNEAPPYASPVVVEVAGVRQLLTQTQRAVIGVELATGKLLWRLPYLVDWDNTIVTPAVFGGDTFVVSAYQHPLEAFRIRRDGATWKVESRWSSREAGVYMVSPVVIGESVWVFTATKNGQLARVDAATGAISWRSEAGLGEHASLVVVGTQLLVLRDDAHLTVVDTGGRADATPRILAEYDVASSPTWAHPVPLADGLLVRDRTHLTRLRTLASP